MTRTSTSGTIHKFKCDYCSELSDYGRTYSVTRFDAQVQQRGLERSYTCQHCNRENLIDRTAEKWDEIDKANFGKP